jgi:uncharacterized protein (TIGR03000 family)
MYSMVLMVAMTSGTTTPDWFGKHHKAYHDGGYAVASYGGCSGSCYGGCWGTGLCYGGWNNCGGGYAGNCYGTCAGGWGIHGYGAFGCHGCYGCYGCYGCVGYAPGYMTNFNPYVPQPSDNDTLPAPKKANGEKESLAPTKAKLIVELPADAKLTVDGRAMKTVSGRGVFTTPSLKKDELYYYELNVEVVRDGKPVAENRRVLVRAGEEVRANFKDMDAVSTARSR